jgi:hypothetical protein
MTVTPNNQNAPAGISAVRAAACEGEEPTTHKGREYPMSDLTSGTANTTMTDTTWLGELTAELTAKQISDLSEQRTELMEIVPTENVDVTMRQIAVLEVEHERVIAATADVPLPEWAPHEGDGWALCSDGLVRRDHNLKTWPTVQGTGDSVRETAATVFAEGTEIHGHEPAFYVALDAENTMLTADESRRLAAQLVEAATYLDGVRAGIVRPSRATTITKAMLERITGMHDGAIVRTPTGHYRTKPECMVTPDLGEVVVKAAEVWLRVAGADGDYDAAAEALTVAVTSR